MLKVFRPENRVWLALALTLAACVWVTVNDDTDNAVPVIPHTRVAVLVKNSSSRTDANTITQMAYRRTQITQMPQSLFTTDAEAVLSETKQVAPPAESAPTLPFVYAGKLVEDGEYVVFLLEGDRNIVAHRGDVIDKHWLVSAIVPPKMTFIYLPLKTKHVLDIGEVN